MNETQMAQLMEQVEQALTSPHVSAAQMLTPQSPMLVLLDALFEAEHQQKYILYGGLAVTSIAQAVDLDPSHHLRLLGWICFCLGRFHHASGGHAEALHFIHKALVFELAHLEFNSCIGETRSISEREMQNIIEKYPAADNYSFSITGHGFYANFGLFDKGIYEFYLANTAKLLFSLREFVKPSLETLKFSQKKLFFCKHYPENTIICLQHYLLIL